MIDQILSQEDLEIEELIALRQLAEDGGNNDQRQRPVSDYGSDEDEYDRLFMKVVSGVEGHTDGAADVVSKQDHEMDISLD